MGEIVNLRTIRRRRDREAEALQAADNRARFGRSRDEAERLRREPDRQRSVLDGARLERDPDPTAG